MSTKAIDISCWQQNVDFNKVRSSGITAVLIRAGYGRETSQKDSEFETHYRGAKAAGLKVGAYWYSYASNASEAVLEAKACLSCIKGKSFDLPVYLDMEEASQARLGRSVLTDMAAEFCDAVRAGGYRAGVYANLNWFNNYLDYSELRRKNSIWLAQWSGSHSLSCDIWQYSSEGDVPGISGDVDMDVIENDSIIGGDPDVDPPDKEDTILLKVSYLAESGYTRTGEQVKTVQRLLNAMGYKGSDGKALTVDGIFGTNTDYAVRRFQKAEGLTVDGIVGPATWKKLTGAT